MKLSRIYSNCTRWVVAASVAVALAGCDNSFVFEDLDECRPDYRVRLSFTKNMENSEKVNLVPSAKLYIFDENNTLLDSVISSKSELIANDFTIPLPKLEKDKKYEFIFWGGLNENAWINHVNATRAAQSKDDLSVKLSKDENSISRNELSYIFHGQDQHTFTKMTGLDEKVIDLTQDVNFLNIMIENAETLSAYEFYIIDKNTIIAFDNRLHANSENVKYMSVNKSVTTFEKPAGNGQGSGQMVKGILASIHSFRLLDELLSDDSNGAQFVIKYLGKEVFKSSLRKLILHDNAVPSGMSSQEYLDREDTFNIFVSVNKEADWGHFSIYVNDWQVVVNNIDFPYEQK